MPAIDALVAVVVLLGATAAIGAIVRNRAGRIRSARPASDDGVLRALVAEHGGLGDRATLLQFSTEFCAPCRATRRVLAGLTAARPGVVHVEIDLTERPELAQRLGILQTPTTFLLDGDGRRRARIGGAARRPDLTAELDAVIADGRVVAR